jgi:hypothetical protein
MAPTVVNCSVSFPAKKLADCSSSVNLAHKSHLSAIGRQTPLVSGSFDTRHFIAVDCVLPKFRCGVHQLTSGF